ncbi:MFS general substrate transporter [Sistotremastrum suecicum HHB10207 ss-3]|uniref:MFS general substrate transporter n=1 Tax=Sistotremastrum suecicum HHB10207 ss-3 TaxID=1314776 RepID=A0A166GBZ8_9AGAM|nr:MFS general substrate transporter [Sistotremastrum suecicum HHB10207 ss-3]
MVAPKGVRGSELTRSQWILSFGLVTSLFFTWGFAYGLLDVLNKHFQVVFGIDRTQSTLLQFAYFGVGYFFWAPVAGIIMRRVGYKKGIHLGLTLYSLGAVFFWPSAVFKKYGGFVGCTCVIGAGLSTLEVAANSYISVLGTPKYAAARLNFAQGFQGVASFTGPLIASRFFFTGKNATTLDTVQWVYLAVAGLGLVLNIMFAFAPLLEITEAALASEMHEVGIETDREPLWKQYRCVFGFVAQFSYVGAQVAVASLAINYMTEQGLDISSASASNLFSACQAVFTFGRFAGVVLLRYIDPALLFSIYAFMCIAFCTATALAPGWAGIVCLFLVFHFESICYPVIFTLGTKNLGRHTKRGSGLIVMGVGGGAWYPSAQAALADRHGSRISYLVPMTGYVVMFIYAVGIVISQARQDGFRFRTVDEIERKRVTIASGMPNVMMPMDESQKAHPALDRLSDDSEKAETSVVETEKYV